MPRQTRTEPVVMSQMGGRRNLEIRMLEAPDAKGAVRRRGRRSRPARVGEAALTAWRRWGMLTTMEVKGTPVKNAFLSSCQLILSMNM